MGEEKISHAQSICFVKALVYYPKKLYAFIQVTGLERSVSGRARLPFSVNILAEEAALAALSDTAFRQATLDAVRQGRATLCDGLAELGCTVWPSAANFLLFQLPPSAGTARDCFEGLLRRGIIIRPLNSYNLPEHLRVSVGDAKENAAFLAAMGDILTESEGRRA